MCVLYLQQLSPIASAVAFTAASAAPTAVVAPAAKHQVLWHLDVRSPGQLRTF